MATSTETLVNTIKEMTVLELNTFVKALEEEFGVSAAAMAMPVAQPGVGPRRPPRRPRSRPSSVRSSPRSARTRSP